MNIGEFGAAKKEAERYSNPNHVPDTFTFFGEQIRVADEVGLMPIMDFAAAAAGGVDTADMAGLAAIRSMLQDCIAEDDWAQFAALSKKNKADGELLLAVVQAVMEVISGRPTEQPSDSSSGLSSSSPTLNVLSATPEPLKPVAATAAVG